MEELRQAALRLVAADDAEAAAEIADRAAADEPLVAAGHPTVAAVHLATCPAIFARQGLACKDRHGRRPKTS